MKTILILLLVAVSNVFAAPRKPLITYDQRQAGKMNVHGKFENFLFFFSPPKNVDILEAGGVAADFVSSLVSLPPFPSGITSLHEESQNTDGFGETEVPSVPEVETTRDPVVTTEKIEAETVAVVEEDHPTESAASASQLSDSVLNLQEYKKKETNENLAKSSDRGKNAKSLKHRSSDISLVSKVPSRNVGSELLENKVAEVGGKDRGHHVESVETEFKLIGDGIENCGPDRFRNQFGICQFREKS